MFSNLLVFLWWFLPVAMIFFAIGYDEYRKANGATDREMRPWLYDDERKR